MNRQQLITEANGQRRLALAAETIGDTDLRNLHLDNAARLHRQAGQIGMARYCERWLHNREVISG